MSSWQPTAALVRASVLAGVAMGLGVLWGGPGALALGAPFALLTFLGLSSRPASAPVLQRTQGVSTLVEGTGTVDRLQVSDLTGVEQVTRVLGQVPQVALQPPTGAVSAMVDPGQWSPPTVAVGARRWGRHDLGDERAALTSAWAGYRWGPVHLAGGLLTVLPESAPLDSRAEAPNPVGLVGANRSARQGSGTEFAGIRPFEAGDRLRRINWRVSQRTGSLHVVTSRAEQDSGVLVFIDALADHGRSARSTGEQSSLDVTVRAGSALVEHFCRHGDRVALRVVGGSSEFVGYGAGPRHLRRLQTALAMVTPGEPTHLDVSRLRFMVPAGTVVLVLSPLLSEHLATATLTLLTRGLPVLVIDPLRSDQLPVSASPEQARWAGLAWRFRLIERGALLSRLQQAGCPVVPWRGPGTLDEVLHRLARRSQLPRVVIR